MTIDQVRRLYREYLGATAGELTVIGDFNPEPTLKQLNEIFAGWKAEKPYARIDQSLFPGIAAARHSILTPDKAGAQYEAGFTMALSDRGPDHAALLLGNFVLGGGDLASRLGERVRNRDGLSYGVSSSYSAGIEDDVGRLSINAICNPANMGKVESAIREEFERLLKDGIPAKEFEMAQQGILEARKRQRNAFTALDANQEKLSARFTANPSLVNAQFVALYFPSLQEIVTATNCSRTSVQRMLKRAQELLERALPTNP